jgi:hypothetical protein
MIEKRSVIVANEHQPTNPFKDYESGGIALAGCFILGVGVGFAIKPFDAIAGAVIGTGVGMIAMALISRDRYK